MMILTMSLKVSSVVDAASGAALDYTVDSLTITGEKLEVKLEMLILFTVKSVVLNFTVFVFCFPLEII